VKSHNDDCPDVGDLAHASYSRLEEIFYCLGQTQEWRQLRYMVYEWLTLKHNVLKYAY
jgi:hypothetical protein